MSGPALLHLSFIAVVVVLLLVAWMAMVLHADEPAPTGQREIADPGKADATDPSAAGRVTSEQQRLDIFNGGITEGRRPAG